MRFMWGTESALPQSSENLPQKIAEKPTKPNKKTRRETIFTRKTSQILVSNPRTRIGTVNKRTASVGAILNEWVGDIQCNGTRKIVRHPKSQFWCTCVGLVVRKSSVDEVLYRFVPTALDERIMNLAHYLKILDRPRETDTWHIAPAFHWIYIEKNAYMKFGNVDHAPQTLQRQDINDSYS